MINLPLKYLTPAFVRTAPHPSGSRLRFFSLLCFLQLLPAPATLQSQLSLQGPSLSHLCSVPASATWYSSSSFGLPNRLGPPLIFTSIAFLAPHMSSVSKFHSLNHLAVDFTGSVLCQAQWERHCIVRPRSVLSRR